MKFRSGLLLGAAFVAGVALGPAASVLDRYTGWGISSAFAQSGNSAEMYRLLTLFGDVVERVRAEYVDPITDRDLIENAINGMLTGLDPHSNYMNAKSFRDMQVQTRGEFGGLGLEVTQENGIIKVVSPIDDTPAFKAGVKAGDLITGLDGQTVQGLTLNEAVEKMRGPAGTPIRLTIKRQGVDTPIELSMNREVIRIQVVRSRLEGDIGYVRLTSFNEQTDPGLRRAITQLRQQAGPDGLKGIILDLRNNPGGLLDQAVSVSDDFLTQGEIVVHPCPPPGGQPALEREAGRYRAGPAGGGADQRRQCLGQRDRGRRAAGPAAGRAGGHAQLRQGIRADGDPAARQRRHAADHGALLHAIGPQHPGAGYCTRRGGAGIAHRAAALHAGA